MDKIKCQCHKAPCICGTGLCNNKISAESTTEPMFQQISLQDFENMECCVTQKSEIIMTEEPPDNDSIKPVENSNVDSIIEKEIEINCIDCCEHIYTPLSDDEQHDCKDECNITAELYCQIKRQNAAPGETFSDCSESSSSEDEDSDDENINGRSVDSELDDEDFFSPDLVPHSSQIEDTNRIVCQKENCCSLNPLQKCKHNRNDQKNVQNKVDDNKNEEVLNHNPNETKWTTMQPKSSRNKKTKKRQLIQIEIKDTNAPAAENESGESEEISDIIKSPTTKGINISDEIKWANIPEIQNQTNQNAVDTEWETIVPVSKEKKSDQSWKRQKLENPNQSYNEDMSIETRKKSSKRVTLPTDFIETISAEIQYIASNRKRKYGSIPNELSMGSISYDRNSIADFNRDETRSAGRKKRITLSNFVTEDQLKEDLEVDDTKLRSERTDAYLLLDKSSTSHEKNPWNTYVACERSDDSILPIETSIKKSKVANVNDTIKPVNNIRRDPRNSFIRQEIASFKPRKFLCFKYIPQISSKTCSISSTADNILQQIAIDPPDNLPLNAGLPPALIQGSRIPISMSKYKTEQKRPFGYSMKRTISFERREKRAQTVVGIDEIRNVVEEKKNVCRRSIIPPERRKSLTRKKSITRRSLTNDTMLESIASKVLSQNEYKRPSSLLDKSQLKQVTYSEANDGSDTSLRNKMRNYYTEFGNRTEYSETPINIKQKQEKVNKIEKSGETKTKLKAPLPAGATTNKTVEKNNNVLQENYSQSGVNVYIKESLTSEKGKKESIILQTVNIDVTPKNSKLIKVNMMPTVPQINKDGVITIPVQFKLCSETCFAETQNVTPKKSPKIDTNEELLYQETPTNRWHEHYMEQFVSEEGDISPQNTPEEQYVNLLWDKMKNSASESHPKENQIDLSLGQKSLSKSLNSLTSDDFSSLQNKSEPVKKCEIDWNDILLPPPGSFVIKKVPIKKSKRRSSGDSNKLKDINMPSTSVRLPPTEENKLKCCSLRKPDEKPYSPANNTCCEEKATREGSPLSEEDCKCTRSNIISLVFSESFYEDDNYLNTLHQIQVEENKVVSSSTSKPEIQWTNILLPNKPQIRRIEKLDTSKTSTSITDQMLTDSIPLSPETTDTYPNLSEVSSHHCDYNININDKGTNTTLMEKAVLHPINSQTTNNMTTYLKSFKEDPVLSAFKAFEEELKPVRKALAELQSKLRALNIPELECIFKKDPEYAISTSNSQIGGDYRQPTASYGRWSADTRRTYAKSPFYCNESLSNCFRQGPSEVLEQHRNLPGDDFTFYLLATPTPPIPMRSRNLSTDIWKAFGSCERNTIKSPHGSLWKSENHRNMRNAGSCNCTPFFSSRYESRNSTPESDLQFVSFESPGINKYTEKRDDPYYPNAYEKRVKMINDDEDLDYPASYRDIPSCPYTHSQQVCYCNSEHSLYSNGTEKLNSSHNVTSFSPECTSSIHTPISKYSDRNIPVNVRPVTHYFLADDEGCDLQNPANSSMRNTPCNFKKGMVYARTKIELPKVVYKRGNNMQKNVKDNERSHYSQSEYNTFKDNDTFENEPNFSSCHDEKCPQLHKY